MWRRLSSVSFVATLVQGVPTWIDTWRATQMRGHISVTCADAHFEQSHCCETILTHTQVCFYRGGLKHLCQNMLVVELTWEWVLNLTLFCGMKRWLNLTIIEAFSVIYVLLLFVQALDHTNAPIVTWHLLPAVSWSVTVDTSTHMRSHSSAQCVIIPVWRYVATYWFV